MANAFYNRGANFNPDELADGDAIEAEFDAVARGFDTIGTNVDANKAGYPAQTFHVAPATEATHAPQKAQLDEHINDQGGVHGATSVNTPDKLVKRDANGDIGARNFVGDCTGNANTATNATQHINSAGGVHGAASGNSPGNLMMRDSNGDVAARAFISETPAKGDSSNKCATTEFLSQQGLRFSNAQGSGIDANITVPIEKTGGWYEIHGAYIVTLPEMLSVPVGVTITFRNPSGVDATIKAFGAESIAPAGSPSANEITIKSGEIITFVNNQTLWYVISCGFGSDSFTVSKGVNGYQRLPSGLIIQWGTNGTSTTGVTSAFPISFPAACLSMVATNDNPSSNFSIATQILSTSQFTLTSANLTPAARWIAIGY